MTNVQEGRMSRQEKDEQASFENILSIESEAEAQILSSMLDQREIPHSLQSYRDSAYSEVFQRQRGWGHLEAPARVRDEVLAVMKELRHTAAGDATRSVARPQPGILWKAYFWLVFLSLGAANVKLLVVDHRPLSSYTLAEMLSILGLFAFAYGKRWLHPHFWKIVCGGAAVAVVRAVYSMLKYPSGDDVYYVVLSCIIVSILWMPLIGAVFSLGFRSVSATTKTSPDAK
jgi:hypothetical protein